MTDEERDSILLELQAGVQRLEVGQKRLEVYVRAIAGRLLAPAEIEEIEAEVGSVNQEGVVA